MLVRDLWRSLILGSSSWKMFETFVPEPPGLPLDPSIGTLQPQKLRLEAEPRGLHRCLPGASLGGTSLDAKGKTAGPAHGKQTRCGEQLVWDFLWFLAFHIFFTTSWRWITMGQEHTVWSCSDICLSYCTVFIWHMLGYFPNLLISVSTYHFHVSTFPVKSKSFHLRSLATRRCSAPRGYGVAQHVTDFQPLPSAERYFRRKIFVVWESEMQRLKEMFSWVFKRLCEDLVTNSWLIFLGYFIVESGR